MRLTVLLLVVLTSINNVHGSKRVFVSFKRFSFLIGINVYLQRFMRLKRKSNLKSGYFARFYVIHKTPTAQSLRDGSVTI